MMIIMIIIIIVFYTFYFTFIPQVTIGDFQKVAGYVYRDTATGSGSSIATTAILSAFIGLLGLIVLVVVVWRLKICVRKNETK